jgi:hypothetical protein
VPETSARLLAELSKVHNWGSLEIGRNIFVHKNFKATACPLNLEPWLPAIVNRANEILRQGSPTPAPSSPAAPAPQQPARKTNDEIAGEVIAGAWGVGEDRKARLAAAGYDYASVQAIVNQRLQGGNTPAVDINALADAVIRGEYGNGDQRKARLGANYVAVQALVNRKLGY